MSNNNEIANTMRALSQRPQTPPKHSLVLDKGTKRLKAVPSDSSAAKNQLAITPEDLRVSCESATVVCSAELIESALVADSPLRHLFSVVDRNVYNGLIDIRGTETVEGVIRTSEMDSASNATIELIVNRDDAGEPRVISHIRGHGCHLEIIPLREQLFSRFKGLHETDAVADKVVTIIAAGSVGSSIIDYFAKLGVMNFNVVDPETIGVENVVRHTAGLASVGRRKTDWAKDHILSKNPYAKVETYPVKVEADTMTTIKQLVEESDLIICTIDNREGKLLLNRIATQAGKTVIYAGCHTRAYGAQVLRCIPDNHESFCYNCFVRTLPDRESDREISDLEQAKALGIHYADRPAPIQPGLGTDIEIAALMAAKIGLQELIKDKDTPLNSLNEDLTAHWYLWLNRREPGTDFENLKPLGFETDDLRILRWYGVEFHRDASCPVCGNGLQALAAGHALETSES